MRDKWRVLPGKNLPARRAKDIATGRRVTSLLRSQR